MRHMDDRTVVEPAAAGLLRGTALVFTGATALAVSAGCGGGGGGAPKAPEAAAIYALTFNLPNYSGVFLDEDLVLRLSAPVKEDSINPDSVRFRTGPAGGTTPFGVFVRGVFMVDPATGTRVVVDPDLGTTGFWDNEIERKGNLGRIPAASRIDLGRNSTNGLRRVIFDKSERTYITFVPEVPTRAVLDDTGLAPASTYTVSVPGYPSTNTLENMAGQQLLSPNNRVFTSTFTTVPATAPQLFLGSESAGIPRIIQSDPVNGEVLVPVTKAITIYFSHPLDPRTVTPDKFKVELVSTTPPYLQLPVSVFLAQQRRFDIPVVLTPINPLPADSVIRVTVDSGIEDLLGQAMVTSNISFSTGFGSGGFVDPSVEEFTDESNSDVANTSSNWNNSKPYVGGVSGELTAAFAPYAGDGTDGAFSAPVGLITTLNTGSVTQRVFNYTTFSIPIGATVAVNGNFPLVIHCQGAVDISGALVLDGSDGGNGLRGDNAGGSATGGAAATGRGGGGSGGAGAMAVNGAGGNFDGLDGFGSGAGTGGHTGENDGGTTNFWPRTIYTGGTQTCTNPPWNYEPCRQREGGGGGSFGTAGTSAENIGATLIARNGSLVPNGGLVGNTYGDGAMSSATTTSTTATVQVKDPLNLGGPLRTIVLNGIPTLVQGGSGGGGGGGEDDKDASNLWGSADGSDEGGGGGGAGGGGVQITSYLTINVAGTISANGGNGGNSYDDVSGTQFSQGAGGGGGSGGAIWLQCRGTLTFQPGSVVTVDGGIGGQGFADGTNVLRLAGDGGLGRVRIEDADGNFANAPAVASTGAFSPALDLDSVATSVWQSTGIFTPKYLTPVIDADVFPALLFNGTIKVYYEGAPEDISDIADNPDTANSTGWILVYDSTAGGLIAGDPWTILDDNKWFRYRVNFHVDAFHTFTDPLPTVRSIKVDYQQ